MAKWLEPYDSFLPPNRRGRVHQKPSGPLIPGEQWAIQRARGDIEMMKLYGEMLKDNEDALLTLRSDLYKF